jgi:predicted nuclease of predicted toxin-antitoxin system
MLRFLVDEDLPRSLTQALVSVGVHAEDVRDVGLRGHPDDDIIAFARTHGLTLLTADLGFANVLRYPLGSHAGIVIVRFPNETPTVALNDVLTGTIRGLSDEDVSGNLLVVEPGRIRLRRS